MPLPGGRADPGPPVGRLERTWRWCRRNPLVAALTAATAVLLLGGTAVATTLAVWALHEKEQAQQSAELEQAARALAEHRFAQAEKAVEQYFDGIENHPRLKEKDFYDLRKQLLASAVPFYEDFVRQKPGDAELEAKRGRAYKRLAALRKELGEREQAMVDYQQMQAVFRKLAADFPYVPEYRKELAASHTQLAFLLFELGKYADEEAEFRQAHDLYRSLVADFPAVREYCQDLARSHFHLGMVLGNGRYAGKRAEQEAEYRQARALLQSLPADFSKAPAHRQERARNHHSLGTVLYDPGREADREAELRRGLALRQELADEFPAVPEYRYELAQSQSMVSNLLYQQRKYTEAEAGYRRVLSLCQSLSDEFPKVLDYQQGLAAIHCNLGKGLLAVGKPTEAKAEYHQALKLNAQLIEQFPEELAHRYRQGRTLIGLAHVLRSVGELAEARRLFVQALEDLQALRTSPDQPFYRQILRDHYTGLAQTTCWLKDHAATAEASARLAQVRPEVAQDAQTAARMLALCVPLAEQDAKLPQARRQQLVRSYGEQATGYLREAFKRGFKGSAAWLNNDPELASLRSRPDFQQLLKELEKR